MRLPKRPKPPQPPKKPHGPLTPIWLAATALTIRDFIKEPFAARTFEDFAISFAPLALLMTPLFFLAAITIFVWDFRSGADRPSRSALISMFLTLACILIVAIRPKHTLACPQGTIVYWFDRPGMDRAATEKKLIEILAANPATELEEYENALSISVFRFNRTTSTNQLKDELNSK
jgi:hypothetical protein